MKSPPAFDSLDASSGENNLFGDKKSDSKHFTKFSFDINNKAAIDYFRNGKFNDKNNKISVPKMADKNIIKMMNPMYYIEAVFRMAFKMHNTTNYEIVTSESVDQPDLILVDTDTQ